MNFLILLLPSLLAFTSHKSEKQTITSLKQQLRSAHSELVQVQARIEKLEEAIAQKEIVRIREEVAKVQEKEIIKQLQSPEDRLELFNEQRGVLVWIICSFPTFAVEAQSVLDEILCLITQIGDQTEEAL